MEKGNKVKKKEGEKRKQWVAYAVGDREALSTDCWEVVAEPREWGGRVDER